MHTEPSKQWLRDNYWIPTTAGVVYVAFVFGMQKYLGEVDERRRMAWLQAEVEAGRTPDVEKAPTYQATEPAWVKALLFSWNLALGLASMVRSLCVVLACRHVHLCPQCCVAAIFGVWTDPSSLPGE